MKISRCTLREFSDSRASSSYLFFFSYTHLHATVEDVLSPTGASIKNLIHNY